MEPGSRRSTLRDGSTHHLKEFNGRTAAIGAHAVSIFRPRIEEYDFTDKRTKAFKKGNSFRCFLVSTSDARQYVSLELIKKDNDMQPLEDAKKKLQEYLRFRMTRASLKSEVKHESISTPQKVIINFSGTKFDPLVATGRDDVEQLCPDPPLSVADCKGLRRSQRFDVTAIVLKVSDSRPLPGGRVVRDLVLLDGSKLSNNKTAEMQLSFFSDERPKREVQEAINLIRMSAGKPVPLSFFGIQGKKEKDGYIFENSCEFFVIEGALHSYKVQELRRTGSELLVVPQEEKETLISESQKDYEKEQGFETLCALLRNMDGNTGCTAIDGTTTVWQLNWVEIVWPSGVELLTKEKGPNEEQRLWFQTSLCDFSGSKTNVWMTEKSALTLSGLEDRNKFMATWAAGDVAFPIMASCKVKRSVSRLGVGEQLERRTNFIVVHACEQRLDEAPTLETLNLIRLMKDMSDDTSCILPAALHTIRESAGYSLEVNYRRDSGKSAEEKAPKQGDLVMACEKVLALVVSTEKSVADPDAKMVDGSYKLITRGVKCLLGSDNPELAGRKYTLSATCNITNVAAFRLDSVRGKPQHALVSITAIVGEVLVVESVQLIDAESAKAAKASLAGLQNLAMHMYLRDKKRQVAWTEESSPATVKKLRVMGQASSGPFLDPPIVNLFKES